MHYSSLNGLLRPRDGGVMWGAGNLDKAVGKRENFFGAHINAPPAIGAIRRKYDRAAARRCAFQGLFQYQWFWTNSVAICAIIAIRAFDCRDTDHAFATEKAVEGTHRTNTPTPTALHHKQVQQKHQRHHGPRYAHAE
jgi:hypothetical protein